MLKLRFLNIFLGSCDHSKACELFADSILNPTLFSAQKQCDTADQALSKKCNKSPVSVSYMGEPNKG